MTPVEKWLHNMKDIWVSKKPDKIASLLSQESLSYFETPFDGPLTKIEDVVSVWQDIKNQDIEYVDIKILSEHGNKGIATWQFKQNGHAEHRGCYYLELDKNGLCTCFRQWWNSKDNQT